MKFAPWQENVLKIFNDFFEKNAEKRRLKAVREAREAQQRKDRS